MRIAILSELYLPHIGGQEVRYAEMAETLVNMGHSVDVYCIQCPKSASAEEEMNGVRVHRRPASERYTSPLFKPLKRRMLPLLRYSLWCRRVVKENAFDLLIYNQFPLAHVILSPSSKRASALLDWCETRQSIPFPYMQRVLPSLVGANTAVSIAVAGQICAQSGQPVSYVPSGVHVGRYFSAPRMERSGLLFVGRITRHKNLGFLVDAFQKMRSRGYEGTLTIGGSGPELNRLKKKIESAALDAQIKVLGPVSEEEKLNLLAKASVLVIPSRREGFPRVVAEAIASNLPVVTVDYPENGTKSVVEQYRLGLVSGPTSDSLANAILNTIENWDTYSTNADLLRHEMDWRYVVENMLHNLAVKGVTK